MLKKHWKIALIFLLVIALFIYNTNKSNDSTKPVVKIGSIAALTGDYSNWGIELKNGLLLAQKLSDKNTKYSYELYIEDSRGELRTTALIANKLIADKVNIIHTLFSPDALVLSEMQKTNDFIQVAATWMKTMTTANPRSFNHWPIIEKEVSILLDEAEKRGYKNLALISVKQAGAEYARDVFIKEYKKRGKEFVGVYDFNFGEKDYRTSFMKLKEKKPDLLIVNSFSPEMEISIKQAKEVGITADWTGLELGFNSKHLDFHEGKWYIGPTKMTEDFSTMYKKEYGIRPAIFAGNSFDVYNMVVKAYETAGRDLPDDELPNLDEVAKVMSSFKNFPSAYGTVSVNQDGTIDSDVAIYEIKNGKSIPQ